jgi:hypothetical protein
LGHELASQTHAPSALHSLPLAHGVQAAPPTPQVALVDVWHCPLVSQHPLGHEVALHEHFPPEHF